MSNTKAVVKGIQVIFYKVGEPVFRMAISHLLDVGYRHMTEENIELTKKKIIDTASKNFRT